LIGVERTDFVGIPTRDRERTVKFYGETLGIERNPRSDPDGNALMLHHRYAPYADPSKP
jgi:catechol 2,3-dioxygenase-like lactoylglutathione lyase family enzyme